MAKPNVARGNAGKGRPPGVPNKVSADVKSMIETALHQAGGIEYLVEQSEKNPTAFMSLVGRLLPKDINANVKGEFDIRAWLMDREKP